MTCGLCNPHEMATHYGANNVQTKVLGYASHIPECSLPRDVANLYFMGASLVLWDEVFQPRQRIVMRPKLALVMAVLRAGDTLLVNGWRAFGDRKARSDAVVNRIEKVGAKVMFATNDPAVSWAMGGIQ